MPDPHIATPDGQYGSAAVRMEHGALVLEMHALMAADLEPWNHDTFIARYRKQVGGGRPGDVPARA